MCEKYFVLDVHLTAENEKERVENFYFYVTSVMSIKRNLERKQVNSRQMNFYLM